MLLTLFLQLASMGASWQVLAALANQQCVPNTCYTMLEARLSKPENLPLHHLHELLTYWEGTGPCPHVHSLLLPLLRMCLCIRAQDTTRGQLLTSTPLNSVVRQRAARRRRYARSDSSAVLSSRTLPWTKN